MKDNGPQSLTRPELCGVLEANGFRTDQLWNFREDTLRLMVRDIWESKEEECE